MTSDIAATYNRTKAVGTKGFRSESKILHVRNINNWVKSYLYNSYLKEDSICLELACGKGGDIPKLFEKKPRFIVFGDFAKESLKECFGRFIKRSQQKDIKTKAIFFSGDCFNVEFSDMPGLEDVYYDFASCQMAFHYSFKSIEMATQAMKNLTERLMPGGRLIITTLNPFELVSKFRKATKKERLNGKEMRVIKNGLFKAYCNFNLDNPPPFGAEYTFALEEAVGSLPEYLVHPSIIIGLAQSFGLSLVERKDFHQLYDQAVTKKNPEFASAKKLYDELNVSKKTLREISDDEWEIVGLYCYYVFQKGGESKENVSKFEMARFTKHSGDEKYDVDIVDTETRNTLTEIVNMRDYRE